MQIERVSTGIRDLDALLNGGIPRGSNVLLIGPPGVGKTVFALHFLKASIQANEPILYVCIDQMPEELKEMAGSFGIDLTQPEQEEKVVLLDAYSWRLGRIPEGRKWYVSNIVNLNELLIRMGDIMSMFSKKFPQSKRRAVMDSLSTLIMYVDFTAVFKMLQVLSAKSKVSQTVGLFTLEGGVHDERIISSLSYIMDGVIEMKFEGDERYLRILKMRSTVHTREWIPFEITREGIKLKIERTSEETKGIYGEFIDKLVW